jgi:hypothetical protein
MRNFSLISKRLQMIRTPRGDRQTELPLHSPWVSLKTEAAGGAALA